MTSSGGHSTSAIRAIGGTAPRGERRPKVPGHRRHSARGEWQPPGPPGAHAPGQATAATPDIRLGVPRIRQGEGRIQPRWPAAVKGRQDFPPGGGGRLGGRERWEGVGGANRRLPLPASSTSAPAATGGGLGAEAAAAATKGGLGVSGGEVDRRRR